MSQAGIINVSGGGGGGAPIQTLTGNSGGAVSPTANNINVVGGSSTVNDPNGITVIGTPGTSTETFTLTNRARVTATTSDGGGQTQTVNIFTPPVSTGIEFSVNFIGYDSANNEVAGGSLEGIAKRSSGGTTSITGTNDTLDEADAGLITADWDIVTNGTLIQAQFIGVAGRSIAWSAVFIYDQTP